MANQAGIFLEANVELAIESPGKANGSYALPAIPTVFTLVDTANSLEISTSDSTTTGSPVKQPTINHNGVCLETIGDDWFGRVHIIPRSFDFGNILGTIVNTVDVFSAFLTQTITWTTFVNNAGAGLEITNLPVLPVNIAPLSGIALNLEVTTNGVPQFDTTLDFIFDVGTTLLPVKGSRVVMFPYEPILPVEETLEFKTDVFEFRDGTEKRFSLRKNPRQSFQLEFEREESVERSRIDLLLYNWQSRVFGLPMHHEVMLVSTANVVDALTINVDQTEFRDLRVGGLALIIKDDEITFDALQIASLTSTSITFTSGLQNVYEPGDRVYPIRTAIVQEIIQGSRYPVGMGTFRINFRVLDNDSNLADTSAFNMFNSKVLLDGKNAIGTTMPESYERKMFEFDGGVGLISHDSRWTRNRRQSEKTFEVRTREDLWNVRQLLYALRGRQISFYIPTFTAELQVTTVLTNGSTAMTITNVGYSRYVANTSPKNIIRVVETDGTILTRTITASAEVDNTTETLTVDTPWPENILPTDIRRVEFLEKVRMNADKIPITHISGLGEATIGFPVKVVFE